MWYLLIPVVCFVLLIGVGWVISLVPNSEKSWKGRIKGLDVILSVLMTAKGYEPRLLMQVPRRVTWLKMTFPESSIRCEVPLITRLQQSRKERYLSLLRDLALQPKVARKESDQDVLNFRAEGPPSRVSAVIKEAFLKLFEVEPTRSLEFRATVNPLDWNVIEEGLQGLRPGDKADSPVAVTNRYVSDGSSNTAVGCIWSLAGFLLLPVPFVFAYLEFGVAAASATLMAILLCREIYRRWKDTKTGFRFVDSLIMLVLGLAGTTIALGDPIYLQLMPSIVLSVAAVAELLPVSSKVSSLWETPSETLPRIGRLLLSAAIVTTCMGGIALNEYLRATASLDTWIWYFAFFRIELVFGFLASAIPFISYQVAHGLKEEEVRDLRGETGHSSECE